MLPYNMEREYTHHVRLAMQHTLLDSRAFRQWSSPKTYAILTLYKVSQ